MSEHRDGGPRTSATGPTGPASQPRSTATGPETLDRDDPRFDTIAESAERWDAQAKALEREQ